MSNRQDLIVKRLSEEGQKTTAYFAGLGRDQLEQQVYLTGPNWRARDILAHFVSAEQPRPDGRDRITDELEKIGYGVDHGDSDVA